MRTGELARRVELACLLEAAARKPGNVHPWAAFDDLGFEDFVRAAEAVAPFLAGTCKLGLGMAILLAVRATRRSVATNANLGIVLLLAPLCAVPEGVRAEDGIGDVLGATTIEDASYVYAAIRQANPGGLGTAGEQDVADVPTCTLTEAMRLAADRDLVARQYAQNFEDAFWLAARLDVASLSNAGRTSTWDSTIIEGFLQMLVRRPDTLIARKCGTEVAGEASRRAEFVLTRGRSGQLTESPAYADFDAWLRGDGHRRNPGATADLMAAALFLVLCEIESAALPPIGQILGWAGVSR
ncbi:triphosphoribosyl-dephospho-CoA synthase [Planctellipticum variicoloris]|uniref:triphosphoribosyl-dephospho-CoA synthase n=1 Tax=Planctellipticum variicoloris TaxID=3064265 RepID=UPI003013D1EC|nr:triphosphoribosyl-dephospho-CoA synthase [Planctomycetaceae bacterium SH412]